MDKNRITRPTRPDERAKETRSPRSSRAGVVNPAGVRCRQAVLPREVCAVSRQRDWGRRYFGFCQTPSVLRALDEWTRRRLRAIAWKQWKRGHARFDELRRRGVGRELAARTAGSTHGPWRLTNSPALSFALPTAYFASLGLRSIAELRL